MISQPSPRGAERSPCAPNRPPFPYEHSLPRFVEKLVRQRTLNRKPRNGEPLNADRDVGLTRTDAEILRRTLDWRTIFPDSCWVTRRTLAKQIGVSVDTIQDGWRRLEREKCIRLEQVAEPGEPDPLEPRNATGWRIHFLFVRTRATYGPGPDRRPNAERSKTPKRRQSPTVREEDIFPPLRGDIFPPPPGRYFSPQ